MLHYEAVYLARQHSQNVTTDIAGEDVGNSHSSHMWLAGLKNGRTPISSNPLNYIISTHTFSLSRNLS